MGFIIKKVDIGEYDQLVVLYTEEFGKIMGVAKSIAKPGSKQAAHLDVLNLVDFELVQGNGHPIITSSISIRTYSNIKKSLPTLALSSFLLETADKLIYSYDPDSGLWRFFINFFEYLDSSFSMGDQISYSQLFYEAQEELLRLLGYLPTATDIHQKSQEAWLNTMSNLGIGAFDSLQFFENVVKLEK